MMPSHVDRPLVYCAGPYAHPDPVWNTNNTIAIADELNSTGMITAVVPHLTLLWHIVCPHAEDFWYDYDLALLARCNALFRIPGASKGADNEVLFANDKGIQVFYEREDLLEWARGLPAN